MSSNTAYFCCWISVITTLCIFTVTAEDRNPGVRVRITQKGLDYGSVVAVDLLMKNKDKMTLSNIYISVAGSSMVLSDMVIKHLPRPHLRLSLVPNNSSPIGRLRADVTQLHPIVDADMRISYRNWLFSASREGSITATGRNLAIVLEAALDLDDAGRPLPRDVQCRASGDIQIRLTGHFRRWSRLFGLVYNTLRSQLKPTIFSELCVNILRDVNLLIANKIANVRMSVEVDNDFMLDYRLTQAPHITRQFVDSNHKGRIYLQSNTTTAAPPFTPPEIPQFPQLVDKMAYMYMSEYIANSGWYAALSSGRLQLNVHENTTSVPEAARRFLSTSCPGSTCLGSMFPRLALLYPNSAARVDVHVANTSQIVGLRAGRSLVAHTEAVAELYMNTARSRDHIVTINLTASCGLQLSFTDNKLAFQVNTFEVKTDVRRNSLHLMTSFVDTLFDSFVAMTSRVVILPTLQMIGSQGLSLIIPTVPELKFIDPVIIDHNIPGLMIVGTDIEYSVPAEMPTTTAAQP